MYVLPLVFPNLNYLYIHFLVKDFHVAKTLLGLSSVFVSVPPPTVKLLLLPDWSVTELPSFKIKKPLVP